MLIFDGVLERFPQLKIGVIELGAVWVPGFLRQLDAAFVAFERHEERLKKLSLTPSDYVRRQLKFTPFPTEPVGGLIEQAGEELFLFSSDYPHPEGSHDPIGKFEHSLDARAIGPRARERFYHQNFDGLFGANT